VIIRFRKSASEEEKQHVLESLKAKGAKVVNTDNVDSQFFPFVVVTLPENQYGALAQDFSSGDHPVVQHI
ncbi:hypothetical protein TREMEDRAFT_24030, partial [Tremella mesenterica DSM 1558]